MLLRKSVHRKTKQKPNILVKHKRVVTWVGEKQQGSPWEASAILNRSWYFLCCGFRARSWNWGRAYVKHIFHHLTTVQSLYFVSWLMCSFCKDAWVVNIVSKCIFYFKIVSYNTHYSIFRKFGSITSKQNSLSVLSFIIIFINNNWPIYQIYQILWLVI